jgi:hypothetical protein
VEAIVSELSDFLTAYAKSYESYDPAKVAEFIHCPCIFFLKGEFVLLDSPEKILDFMRAGLEAYRGNDCEHFRAELIGERKVGPRFAIIDVEWAPENASGQRTMHFSTTYNLVREAGAWKVALITRHDS